MSIPDRTSRSRRTLALVVTGLLAGLTLLVTLAGPASAHRGAESYLYLDVADRDLEGSVQLPYEDLRTLFGYTLSGSGDEVRAELDANRDQLIDYIQSTTAIGTEGETWAVDFDGLELLSEDGGGDEPDYAIFPFSVNVPGEVPRDLELSFTPFVDEIENRRTIVLVANDWKRGVFDEEANELLFLSAGDRSGSIDLGDPSQWLNFSGSIETGVDHIRTGPDHVLFMLVLVLPAVLVFGSAWQPVPSFGSSLWRVLKIVTMFTIAHSVTFTAAGLDLFPLPPSQLVETVIAISIAAAAIHNIRPIVVNREWVLAFVFGLFHGFGFASLVESLDVDRTTQLVSLLGRNVGIEIGQAIVILMIFPALYLLRRTRYYQPLFVLGSVVLAVVSLVWAAERIFDFDLGTTDLALVFLRWPRILIVMVLATIAAALIHRFEDQAGRLLPVAETDRAQDEAVPAASAG